MCQTMDGKSEVTRQEEEDLLYFIIYYIYKVIVKSVGNNFPIRDILIIYQENDILFKYGEMLIKRI